MSEPLKPFVYRGEVVRIVDGDTIDVVFDLGFDLKFKERVRLYDVDTPEVYGAHAEPMGKVASEFTAQWCEAAGFAVLVDSRKYNARGKYGRVLGEIYREGDPISLNKAIENAGLIKGA